MSGRKFLEQFSWDFSIVWNFDKSTFFIINIVMPWNWLIDWSQLFENQLSTFLTESVFSVQTHLHFLLYSYLYLHIYLSIHIHNIHIYKLISTYRVSSARLESRVLNHMKIVDPPPGVEPGPLTFWAGVQPLQKIHYENPFEMYHSR